MEKKPTNEIYENIIKTYVHELADHLQNEIFVPAPDLFKTIKQLEAFAYKYFWYIDDTNYLDKRNKALKFLDKAKKYFIKMKNRIFRPDLEERQTSLIYKSYLRTVNKRLADNPEELDRSIREIDDVYSAYCYEVADTKNDKFQALQMFMVQKLQEGFNKIDSESFPIHYRVKYRQFNIS